MSEFKQDRGNAIVQGALSYAGKNARIGTVGWCFGGGQALQAALTAGKQAVACVMYYGMPELEPERLQKLRCPVLGIFARRDHWITPQLVQRFQQAMRRAGKQLTVVSYDADHAFANPSNPQFDPRAAEDARRRAREFIRRHLRR
jgi:carboxymethylenebutenolidase